MCLLPLSSSGNSPGEDAMMTHVLVVDRLHYLSLVVGYRCVDGLSLEVAGRSRSTESRQQSEPSSVLFVGH